MSPRTPCKKSASPAVLLYIDGSEPGSAEMMRFGKRREDSLGTLLHENRPEPRDDFLAPMLRRAASERPLLHVRGGVGRRLALAAAVTVAAGGTAVGAGAVSSASSGLRGLAHIAQHTFSQSAQHTSLQAPGGQTGSVNGASSSHDSDQSQYRVTICHRTGSTKNPYVTLVLSPQGAAQHLAHHPDDFIAPPGGCPTHL
jgi:hypothetical protein